jgi:hypothetical protein
MIFLLFDFSTFLSTEKTSVEDFQSPVPGIGKKLPPQEGQTLFRTLKAIFGLISHATLLVA